MTGLARFGGRITSIVRACSAWSMAAAAGAALGFARRKHKGRHHCEHPDCRSNAEEDQTFAHGDLRRGP